MRTLWLAVVLSFPILAAEPNFDSLFENGHWKRARDFAEANFRAHPNDSRAAYLLARVRHEFGNLDEAQKYAETAVRLDPKSSAAHRELGEIYADQADKVSFLKQIGLARKLHAEFDAALALAPKDPANMLDQMLYFLQAPGIVGGDRKKAADIASEIVRVDPVRGYLAQARMAREQKEDGKLESLYQKAVEANPKDYQARISLAGYYLGQRPNPSLAEQHSRVVLDLNPDRISGYRFLAIALVLEKRVDEAAQVIARAETAIPDDLSPYVNAARAMLREGIELQRAETYLKKYLTETKEPEANSPTIAAVHWSLGLVYEKQGRKPEARSELETSLRLKPDFEPAKKDLKRLK